MEGVFGGMKGTFGVDRCFGLFRVNRAPGGGGSTIFGGNSWLKGMFGGIKGTSGVDWYFWPFSDEPPPGRGDLSWEMELAGVFGNFGVNRPGGGGSKLGNEVGRCFWDF